MQCGSSVCRTYEKATNEAETQQAIVFEHLAINEEDIKKNKQEEYLRGKLII